MTAQTDPSCRRVRGGMDCETDLIVGKDNFKVRKPAALSFTVLALALAGCATPTTGIVLLADGLHRVTRSTNAGAFYDAQQLKAEAVQEATSFCAKAGKQYRLVDITQRPPRPLGGWPETEVLFRCE